MPLNPLNHHYAMENPTSVYDEEAMTALELAGRTTAKVNETVEAFNKLETETNKHLAQQDADIPVQVANKVQEHINRGSFDHQIDLYAGGLENRVDNLLAKVVPGSTTMDAEIIDGRTDPDGYAFQNIGNAIRGAKDSIQAVAGSETGANRLIVANMAPGYLDMNGVLKTDTDKYMTTDFIPVAPGERIATLYKGGIFLMRFVCLYDKEKRFISSVENRLTYQKSGDCAYVRISIEKKGNMHNFTIVNYENGLLNSHLPKEMLAVTNKLVSHNPFRPELNEIGFYLNWEVEGIPSTNPAYFTSYFMSVTPGDTLTLFNENMTPVYCRIWGYFDIDGNYIGFNEGDATAYSATVPSGARFMKVSTPGTGTEAFMVAPTGSTQYVPPGGYVVRDIASGEIRDNALYTYLDTTNGQTVELNFPHYTKKDTVMVAHGLLAGSLGSITLGRGKTTYGSLWFTVTATNLEIHSYITSEAVTTVAHGLTFTSSVFVMLEVDAQGKYKVTLADNMNTFTHEGDTQGYFCGPVILSNTGTMGGLCASVSCKGFDKPVWVFGDSYMGPASDRVWGQLMALGYNNYLLSAQPGLGSAEAYNDLLRCLAYGKPETLVWCLGMNDTYEVYAEYLPKVCQLCREKGIRLVVARIPSCTKLSKEDHDALLHEMKRAYGFRILNWYGAVGASASGVWNGGLQSGDGCHPTEDGARCLAFRTLIEAPEIVTNN